MRRARPSTERRAALAERERRAAESRGAGRAATSPRHASPWPARWPTPCSPTSSRSSAPGVDVLFLDTGYHFAETLGTRDAVASDAAVTDRRRPARADRRRAGRRVRRRAARPRPRPLLRAAQGRAAAARARRLRGVGHRRAPRRGAHPRRHARSSPGTRRNGLVKVNPLAAWTDDDVDRYAGEHQVAASTRCVTSGYPSIGCEPCTRPVAEGEDPRAGRWAGIAKTECGLHT